MDYSKQNGGTRVLDQGKARTLSTGIGSTVEAARHTGSHRAAKVVAGIKPGQLVHDRLLAQESKHRDSMDAQCATGMMDGPNTGPAPSSPGSFPMLTGSKSHSSANGMDGDAVVDQGENKLVKTTGQKRGRGTVQGL